MQVLATTVSQQRLRDLAPRAVRVVGQYEGVHPTVAAVGPSLVPAAEAYIKVYDEALVSSAAQRREMEAGRDCLEEVLLQVRAGLAIVHHAMPAFDETAISGTVDTPDRLISDGHRLIELIAQGNVPQGDAITALIKAALDKAEPQWAQAQNARRALQMKQAEVRQQALAINRELVTLRRVLRTVVGTSDLAYQSLRVARVMSPAVIDEDDSVVEDTPDDTVASPNQGVSNGTVANGVVTNGAATNGKGGAPFSLGVNA